MEILILIRYVSILDWNKLEDSILRNPLFVWCIKVYKCVLLLVALCTDSVADNEYGKNPQLA